MKLDEDRYGITMAVAGFAEKDIEITAHRDQVTVSGKKDDEAKGAYLYRGIANRAFERTFRLADHVKVTGAELKDGLLTISLQREVPEAAKPRSIAINGQKTLAAANDAKSKDAA